MSSLSGDRVRKLALGFSLAAWVLVRPGDAAGEFRPGRGAREVVVEVNAQPVSWAIAI